MAKAKKPNHQQEALLDQSVVIKVVAIASILLGAMLAIVTAILTKFLTVGSSFEKALLTGGNLFVFWLVVTSAVRTVERLRKGIPKRALMLTGFAVSVCGILFQQLIFWIAGKLHAAWAITPGLRVLKFYAAAGLVVSLIALIHLRVRNKRRAKQLEILVIVLLALLFFYFAG